MVTPLKHQTGSQVVLVQCFVLSTTQRPYFNLWTFGSHPMTPHIFVFFSHWMPKIMLSPNDPSFFEPVLSPNAPACWRAGLTPVSTSYLTAPPPPPGILAVLSIVDSLCIRQDVQTHWKAASFEQIWKEKNTKIPYLLAYLPRLGWVPVICVGFRVHLSSDRCWDEDDVDICFEIVVQAPDDPHRRRRIPTAEAPDVAM